MFFSEAVFSPMMKMISFYIDIGQSFQGLIQRSLKSLGTFNVINIITTAQLVKLQRCQRAAVIVSYYSDYLNGLR